MSKKENKAKAAKTNKTSKSRTRKKEEKEQVSEQAMTFIKSDKARKIAAISMMLFCLFLLVSFISHFFTGANDQSVVEAGILGNPIIEQPNNWLGSVGAWFGFKFISQGFGLTSMLIPMFGILLGFAMLENNYYSFVSKVFKYSLFTLLWGSLFLSFITFFFKEGPTNLGGGFGWYINDTLINFYIGKIGMGILLVMIISVFLVFNFNTEFKISEFIMKLIPKKSGLEEKVALSGDAIVATGPVASLENVSGVVENRVKEKEDKEEKKESEDLGIIGLKEESPTEKIIEVKEEDQIPIILQAEVPLTPPMEVVKEGDKLELEIAEGDQPAAPEPEADNIVEVKDDTFQKFVPEEDKEVLDDEEDVGDWEQYDPTRELSDYKYPPIDLLQAYDTGNSKEVNRTELEENKNKIVRTLKNYNIEIISIKATIGPTITLYEIVPAPGIRISKIKNLEDDIALSLAALGIRIIAPIPGRGTIGIEIPNSNPEIVSMRSTLATEKFRDVNAELPLALGRTISNEVFIADLAKMPHLLIAGATGQGKSVGINGLIASLLYKKHPAQIKFVLIDPKKVELNLYTPLVKHFLATLENMDDPIITDTKQVINVLNSLCIEMDQRYDLLKKAKCRNLKEYNTKFTNRKLNPKKGHRFLPYIVLIIDEFADLMMTAGKEIEQPIARLAQLARAIGIHLVLATQRPSVNVITGIIKANFPARVSFRVTSKVDSRTILDSGGADQLIGRGDLLLSMGNDLVRLQNPFIDTPEVDKLVDYIAEQRGYPTPYYLPEVPDADTGGANGNDDDDRDDMFGDAARLIVQHQQGSTSLIQRRMKLGYNRAGRIIDQLERAGIVGPFSGSKARAVLVQDEYTLEQLLQEMGES